MWYRRNERATFIQIGANDGVTNDPLYIALGLERLESKWIGLQVEPSPALFANVTNLHRNASGWSFYNGAMANATLCANGIVTFLESPQSGFGAEWWEQGQVNTLNAKTPHRSVLVPTNRSCLTSFDHLLERYASPELRHRTLYNSVFYVDILMIDVEGFDDKIIELINWDTLSPHCIHFEIFHINATFISSFLEKKGYSLLSDAMDTLACRVADTVPSAA